MSDKNQMRDRLNQITSKLLPQVKMEITAAQQRQTAYEKEATSLTLKLAPKVSESPTVSDHAVLRYLERKYKLDIDELKQEILTPDRVKMIEAGAREIAVDGIRFKIQNKTIVTTI